MVNTKKPRGSYSEEHILNFLETHLERWGPGRRWELLFLDAYAPGLTDNVQRCCWHRGYIEITHGGGASMVAQTNDTDHHLWVRKRFIEMQTGLMIQKARATGGGLVDLAREENIDIMIEVMSDVNLHLHAAKGYKKMAPRTISMARRTASSAERPRYSGTNAICGTKLIPRWRKWKRSSMLANCPGIIRRCNRSSASTRTVAI